MNEQEILRIFDRTGAVITDSHVVYTSGKHGSAYVNKDAVYPYTKETSMLCFAIAALFNQDDDRVEVVIAPAIGGVILSQWTAHRLTTLDPLGRPVLALYAEKDNEGKFVIRRGYDKLVAGKRVLVVEDVLNTGATVRAVIEAVRAVGGNVVGIGALCNRGGLTAEDLANVPKLGALVNVKMDAHDESDCPLCDKGVPINTDVGKGREFLARKSA